MKASLLLARLFPNPHLGRWTRLCAFALIAGALASIGEAQTTDSPAPMPTANQAAPVAPAQSASPAPPETSPAPATTDAKPVRNADRRRATKLFLASGQLFEKERFEEAMHGYEEAARLDPGNTNYPLAAAVARSHAVTALIQTAAKSRLGGNAGAARAALAHALELDPQNAQLNEHLNELGDDALLLQARPPYAQAAGTLGTAPGLAPTPSEHSFHLHTDQRQTIQQVLKAYGIEVTVDESVRATQIRLDMDNADFEQATRTLGMVTTTFFVPLDAHRVLVARDTRENRQQFMRLEQETVYLPGLSTTELTDVTNLAKSVFDIQQAVAEPTGGTLTLRAPERSLNAFNTTMGQLLDGRNQVMLEVRLIQIAHTSERKTGLQTPGSMGMFNVAAEAQSILNANQSLVQQIISSGLASPGDTLKIIAILLASGQVSSSIFSSGFATFGGGTALTTFGLIPGSVGINLSLNSSESRELDLIQLHLGDGEAGTIRTGTRYPIQTSSFSSLSGSLPNIPGLTGAGASGGLASLLSSFGGGVPNVPQVEYQDLGLTLKATPRVMRDNLVALTLDLKIDALSGGSINGNPILNNRAFSGVTTIRQGESVVVVSELDKQESRAVSGTPGIGEIPGLNSIDAHDTQKNYASLLIVITPHVIRGTQAAGHSQMMRVERVQTGR